MACKSPHKQQGKQTLSFQSRPIIHLMFNLVLLSNQVDHEHVYQLEVLNHFFEFLWVEGAEVIFLRNIKCVNFENKWQEVNLPPDIVQAGWKRNQKLKQNSVKVFKYIQLKQSL